MIKISLKKNDNMISEIVIKGHAMYADFGKDIVCSAVSSTVITSINAALLIDNTSILYDDRDGLLIKVLKNDNVTTKIIANMMSNLYDLEKAYPKNILIKEENNE
ncbi:MAG: ribosomal-processing cysteine protease Prp [Bacilli bacterium]